MSESPEITLTRRGAQYMIVHSCLFCDHAQVQIGHQCIDKICPSNHEDCREYSEDKIATMTARRHGRIISSSHLDGDYLIQSSYEAKHNDLITEAFPELTIVEGAYEMRELTGVTVRYQARKSKWHCFDCPCNDGETKTYRSAAGLYNHRKTCKGHPAYR